MVLLAVTAVEEVENVDLETVVVVEAVVDELPVHEEDGGGSEFG